MSQTAYSAFKLSFEASPIVLVNGLAAALPGGLLPIIALTESIGFAGGLLQGSSIENLDSLFAHFQVAPGGTLVSQDLGRYPFANQSVAANAVIAQPNRVSMLMYCPVKADAGYPLKLATMMALVAALKQHNASGGTYVVATPANFYTDLVMLRMEDVSGGDSAQVQRTWRFDFEQPLLTLDQAQQAQGALMSKLSQGLPISGDPTWSGLATTVGQTGTLATVTAVPLATNPAAAGISPLQSDLSTLY